MSVQCMCTSLVMLFMHCIRIHRAKIFIQVYYLYGAKIPCNNKPKKMQSIFFKLVWYPSQVPFSRYRLFLLIIKHAKLCIAFHLFLASAHKHIHVCSLRICETEKNGFFSSTNKFCKYAFCARCMQKWKVAVVLLKLKFIRIAVANSILKSQMPLKHKSMKRLFSSRERMFWKNHKKRTTLWN